MKNNGVKYGLFYGLILSVLGLTAYFINPRSLFNPIDWQSILSFLFMLGLMYWAAKETRAEKGGYLGFGEAFVPAFLVSVIGSFIYTLLNYVLIATNPELLDFAATASTDLLYSMYSAIGFSEDQTQEMLEQVEDMTGEGGATSVGGTIIGMIFNSFFVALPFSAIIAAIVKKKRPEMV